MLSLSIGNGKLAHYNLGKITHELGQLIELQADKLRCNTIGVNQSIG